MFTKERKEICSLKKEKKYVYYERKEKKLFH